MDERVKALENFADQARGELRAIDVRLTKIETKLDQLATKEDVKALSAELHRELHTTTWKLIGAMGLICATVFWIARNVEPPRTLSSGAAYYSTTTPRPASQPSAVQAPAPQAPAPAQPTAK
ncbi:hypothetical protein [Massilia sp. X63]|uniref:hypothetical protein n=1 Tax=Massilia sp. X63 TaxID=3237285 RepID=UPI0034DD2916